jgi:hypothetical protein
LRMDDVREWGLEAEEQEHRNPTKTYANLRKNGATDEEATFVADGQRVELNMLTGPEFVEFVEKKLEANSVRKIVPDAAVLDDAWRRATLAARINRAIREMEADDSEGPRPPDDLAQQIRDGLAENPRDAWDDVVYLLAGGAVDDNEDHDDEADDGDYDGWDEWPEE